MKNIKDLFNSDWQVKEYLKEYKQDDINLKIIKSLKPQTSVLSLGCGGGREVKALLEQGHEVTAVDFAPNMIEQSKSLAPQAKYLCADAIAFAKNYDVKFDYILGLHSFLNYIFKKDRKELIANLIGMLNPGGELIFEVRFWNERFIDSMKALLSYPFVEEFGDTYTRSGIGRLVLGHQYTLRQLKRLFSKYNYTLDRSIVRVKC